MCIKNYLYKKMIKRQEYNKEAFVNYVETYFSCEDITEDMKHSNLLKIFTDNLKKRYPIYSSHDVVFYKLPNNGKNKSIYHYWQYDELYDYGWVYLLIDKNTGDFETNSTVLSYKLTMEKGVDPHDFDENGLELMDAIVRINDYMIMINEHR